jgi:hypothetical protein
MGGGLKDVASACAGVEPEILVWGGKIIMIYFSKEKFKTHTYTHVLQTHTHTHTHTHKHIYIYIYKRYHLYKLQ